MPSKRTKTVPEQRQPWLDVFTRERREPAWFRCLVDLAASFVTYQVAVITVLFLALGLLVLTLRHPWLGGAVIATLVVLSYLIYRRQHRNRSDDN